MHSRSTLFQPDSVYTRLRLAYGDGKQRLQAYFHELKLCAEDPRREMLIGRLTEMLPDREAPIAFPQKVPIGLRSTRGGAAQPPRIIVMVGDDVRIGPGRSVPGKPDFAGSLLPPLLEGNLFWVRVDELPPEQETLISVVPHAAVEALHRRHSGLASSNDDDVHLLEAAFSDEGLADLDIARILSAAPTLTTHSDAGGHMEVAVEVETDSPPLPAGAYVVVVAGPV